MRRWHEQKKRYRHPYYRMSRKQLDEELKEANEIEAKQKRHDYYKLKRPNQSFSEYEHEYRSIVTISDTILSTLIECGWIRDNILVDGMLDGFDDVKTGKELNVLCKLILD